jgi:hypothetical protein
MVLKLHRLGPNADKPLVVNDSLLDGLKPRVIVHKLDVGRFIIDIFEIDILVGAIDFWQGRTLGGEM